MSVRNNCVERATVVFGRVFDVAPMHGGIAPGRVNLIGDHTDHTGGYVLPIAIDLRCAAVGRLARNNGRFRAHAADLNETIIFDPAGEPDQLPTGHWGRYVAGVVAGFVERGCDLPGIEICIASDVPMGAGLSSSAALEVAVARLVAGICQHEIGPRDEALLCQRAEHRWAGVPCGVMDQMAATMSRKGHAMLIDCTSLKTQHVPIPANDAAAFAVFNTNVKHALADGEYAHRRAACEGAVRVLGVSTLRQATPALIEASAMLSDEKRRCARHVVTENERTVAAADALRSGDLAEFGRLMVASHASLRDDMRVSCDELDTLVDLAVGCAGVYGARMTGGGFGGCAVVLVETGRWKDAVGGIAQAYNALHGRDCTFMRAAAMGGARPLVL